MRNHCMSVVGRECRPLPIYNACWCAIVAWVLWTIVSPACRSVVGAATPKDSLSHCHYHCECHPHYHYPYHCRCHCNCHGPHHDHHTEGFAPIWIDLEHGPAFLVAQWRARRTWKTFLQEEMPSQIWQAKGNMRLFCWASIYALSMQQVMIEGARSQPNAMLRPGLCVLADLVVWKDCLQLPSTGPKPT